MQHPDILKAERLGSRDKNDGVSVCTVCGRADDGSFFVSSIGQVFCGIRCIELNFKYAAASAAEWRLI